MEEDSIKRFFTVSSPILSTKVTIVFLHYGLVNFSLKIIDSVPQCLFLCQLERTINQQRIIISPVLYQKCIFGPEIYISWNNNTYLIQRKDYKMVFNALTYSLLSGDFVYPLVASFLFSFISNHFQFILWSLTSFPTFFHTSYAHSHNYFIGKREL